MRWSTIAIRAALMLICLSIFAASAQDKTSFFVEINNQNPGDNFLLELVEALSERLVGVEVIPLEAHAEETLTYGPFWFQDAVQFLFTESSTFLISPYNTHHLSTSPTLRGNFDFMTSMALESGTPEETDAAALDLATALSWYVMEDCQKAVEYFDTIETALLEDMETRVSIAFYQGNCALLEGDLETALTYFESILNQIDESRLHLYSSTALNTAWTLLKLERTDEALSLMDRVTDAAQQADTSAEHRALALSARAQIYALNFQFDDAIADIDAAIELDPLNPELYVERGNIVMLLYEWDRVLENYNTALELDTHYADAYFYRGVLLYSILEREAALTDFEHYLILVPGGAFAEEAQHYRDSIRTELEALSR